MTTYIVWVDVAGLGPRRVEVRTSKGTAQAERKALAKFSRNGGYVISTEVVR